MDAATFCALGPPTLQTARGREPFPAERRFQLLAYLACRNTWVTRDELAGLFWPDHENAAARSNLRYVLLKLRRDGLAALEARGDLLRWQVDADLHRFERAVAESDWAGALALYRGVLLDGLDRDAPPAFVDWMRFERARVAGLHRRAIGARLDELAGDPASAAALAQQVLHDDPFDEAAMLAWLRAAAAQERPDDVLRAYGAYVRRLAGDLGVEPSAALREAAARLASPVVARSAPALPGFIGRRTELAQVRQLLGASDCRVLTVLGIGGAGKSTLARAAAAALAAQFDDVLWIELDELSSSDQVAPRLARHLGIEVRGTQPALEAVLRHLRARRTLLVFDSAEHLAGVDRIVAVLARECAALKILVTSRVRLALAGEWLLPLDGLPVPDADETELDVLRAFDAVQLFEVRAASAAPGFDLRAHAGAVAALTRMVEGLPLALELAAARVRMLPVEQIAREIAASLDAIEPASGEQRDRSLRASFAHSWRLLAPAEREALGACAVFPGSFSCDAIRAIAGTPLPLLAALVDKSLLRADGQGRFSLHALIRQYALEQLDAVNAAPLRTRHADCFARTFAACADMTRVDPGVALAALDLERHNLRAAWLLAIEQRVAPWIEALAVPLRHLFENRGPLDEGIALLMAAPQALDVADARHARAIATAQRGAATLLATRGRLEESEALARVALAWFEAASDPIGVNSCLNTIAISLFERGRYAEAGRHFARVQRNVRGTREVLHEASAASNLAMTMMARGDFARARKHYANALAIARRTGDIYSQAVTLGLLGVSAFGEGDWNGAAQYLEEGVALAANRLMQHEPYLLVDLALCLCEKNDLPRAAECARRGLRLARDFGQVRGQFIALAALAQIAARGGEPRQAGELLGDALAVLAEERNLKMQLFAVMNAGEVWLGRGERERTATFWHFVAGHPQADAIDRASAQRKLKALALEGKALQRARAAARGLQLDPLVQQLRAEFEAPRAHMDDALARSS